MSCMEHKTVIRAEIPSIKGLNLTDAYNYFKEILGEARYIDNYDTEVYWFEYDGKYQPVYDHNNKKWGIDLVVGHKSDYKTYIDSDYENGLTLKEFENLANELYQKFDIKKENIRLLSYDWYNGGDEPVSL